MPFRKNIERENVLLSHWKQGFTVKKTSLLTGIPEGTISHYYARFNRSRDKDRAKHGSEEPPRSRPIDVAISMLNFRELYRNVKKLLDKGDYAKLCNYLQSLLLFMNLSKQLSTIIGNRDPNQADEIMLEYLKHMKLFNTVPS